MIQARDQRTVSYDEVKVDTIHQLYAVGAPGIFGNFMLAAIMAFALRKQVPLNILLWWLAANALINLIRFCSMSYALKKERITASRWRFWGNLHAFLAGLGSVNWGLAIVFFAPAHSEMALFAVIAVCGLTAAAFAIIAIYYTSYVVYALPLILALACRFFMSDMGSRLPLTILGLLYAATIMRTSKTYSENYFASTKLRLQFDRDAHTDSLTGLANRRSFDERLDLVWHQLMRSKSELSLLMIDIDNFKRYNDLLGHQAGDDCLERVAQGLQSVFRRAGDFVARLGGEEFAVLIPVTARSDVGLLAETARKAIEGLRIAHPADSVAYVTVSIGFRTVVPSADLTMSALIRSADRALYQAKNNGRNQVVEAQP